MMRWGALVQRKYSRLSLRAASTASEPGEGEVSVLFRGSLGLCCVCLWRRTRGRPTGAHEVDFLHGSAGALDEPVGEVLDGGRLEVCVGDVRAGLHLGGGCSDDFFPAVSDTGHTGAAAGVEDSSAVAGVPVVAFGFCQDGDVVVDGCCSGLAILWQCLRATASHLRLLR